jgi:hypothetical protein
MPLSLMVMMIGIIFSISLTPNIVLASSNANLPFYISPADSNLESVLNETQAFRNPFDPCPPFWQICDFMLFLNSIENNTQINNMTVSLNITDGRTNATETFNGTPSDVVIKLTNSSLAYTLTDRERAITLDEINHLVKSLISTASDSRLRQLDGELRFSVAPPSVGNTIARNESLSVSMSFDSPSS